MTQSSYLYDVVSRGRLFLAVGDPTTAADLLGEAADLVPGDKSVLTDLARARFDSAQLHRALETFTTLVELDPTDVWARRGMARTLRRLSRRDESVVHDRVADALEA